MREPIHSLAMTLAMLLLVGVIVTATGTGHARDMNLMKRSARGSPTRSMVYFIKRGIDIPKREYSFLERVKRSLVGGEDNDKPQIQSLSVFSNISSRFSNTVMNSIMHNPGSDDKEATFRVYLPEQAFMSNFTMLIEGELYVAEVKSKEDAAAEYEKAKEENKTAGLVENMMPTYEEEVRGMELFKISVNVAANSSVEFDLTYLELLQRRGLYEQKISVRPDQIVDDLTVTVLIYEPQGITHLDVMEPGTNTVMPMYTEITHSPQDIVAEVVYHPNTENQKQMSKRDQVGVKGELVVRYDVQHDSDLGLVQVEGDYFVHFFSPETSNMDPLPKNIVFVIDISGSMSGDKIVQTRDSMLVILNQLRQEDKFLIILFDDTQEFWPEAGSGLVSATTSNIESAKNFVRENVKTRGGTNINDALVVAARKLNFDADLGAKMIVFLTDGEPTVGVTSTDAILENVGMATEGTVSIFSLGFGFNLNFDLLRAISFRNHGFARRIYADVDADVQLQNFFDEINTPVLYDVSVDYGSLRISLTQTNFAQYFQGSEIIIAGMFETGAPEGFDVKVAAVADQPWEVDQYVICTLPEIPPRAQKIFRPGSLERLYIYMKIKDLMRKVLMTDDKAEKDRLEGFALQMALEYHLVTPLTSFVIVQRERPIAAREEMAFDMGSSKSNPGLVSHSTILSRGDAAGLSLSINRFLIALGVVFMSMIASL